MLFNKKSLTELISAFQSKEYERAKKIKTKIDSLEREAEGINADIETEAGRLVASELEDDVNTQAKSSKSISKLRQRLVEVQDLAAAYRKELDKGTYNTAVIEAIRAAAKREREARHKRSKELAAQAEHLKQQIEELERQLKQANKDYQHNNAKTVEGLLLNIGSHIEPRLKLIPNYAREKYLQHWISGNAESMQQVLELHLPKDKDTPQRNVQHICPPEKVIRVESEEPVAPKCIRKTRYVAGSGQVTVATDEGTITKSI